MAQKLTRAVFKWLFLTTSIFLFSRFVLNLVSKIKKDIGFHVLIKIDFLVISGDFITPSITCFC